MTRAHACGPDLRSQRSPPGCPLRPIPAPSIRPWAGHRLGEPADHVGELWLAGPDSSVETGPRRAGQPRRARRCRRGRPCRRGRDAPAWPALPADRQADRRRRVALAPGPSGGRPGRRALRRRGAGQVRGVAGPGCRRRDPARHRSRERPLRAGAPRRHRCRNAGAGRLRGASGGARRHAADRAGHAPRDRRRRLRLRDRAAVGPDLPDLGLGPPRGPGTGPPPRRVPPGDPAGRPRHPRGSDWRLDGGALVVPEFRLEIVVLPGPASAAPAGGAASRWSRRSTARRS